MASELHLPSREHTSLYKVTRELKKEQHSLFNCINSIIEDAAFVKEIALLYPGVPLLANLRCGLWYTAEQHAGTCYFKSTDGHSGNWSFSTTRLNWHVAELAARQGGCLIVDATRKGKRFPVSRQRRSTACNNNMLVKVAGDRMLVMLRGTVRAAAAGWLACGGAEAKAKATSSSMRCVARWLVLPRCHACRLAHPAVCDPAS